MPGPGSRRCAVLGSPIAHSLSPVIHQAAYRHLGIDWTYTAHEVDEAGLAGFVDSLDASWRGLSLTMPLKRVALDVADEVWGLAQMVGAANTLLRDDDGRWQATNTDVSGAKAALVERGVTQVREACVWGGGATAVSMLAALTELDAQHIHVHARSEERTRRSIAPAFRWRPSVEISPWRVGSSCGAAGLTVATTPAGVMDAVATELTVAPTAGRHLFDVVYHPWPTTLAARWSAGGGAVVSGLDLLIHQAAEQIWLMTGDDVPVAVLRAAAETGLAARTAM